MAEGGSKLSEEQIYESLKCLNVPLRMNDLKVPSREFIVRVFECFLRDLQIDITSPKLKNWETMQHIEDADIYEDAQLLILLTMSVNHITYNPSGLNITIKDIVEPKPKRTKKILNYLIVFWNYYLRKYARFHTMVESYDAERVKVEQVIEETKGLVEKYNDLKVALNSMEPSKEELSSIVKVLEDQVAKLNSESETLGVDYQNLKTKANHLRDQIATVDVSIITAKEKLKKLSELILSSPDRISKEIHNLEEKIRNEETKIKECENKLKDAIKKIELKEEDVKEAEKDLVNLNETNNIRNNISDLVKSLKDVNQKVMEEEDLLKQLKTDLERKQEFKLQTVQKSVQLGLNTRKQIETLREVLQMHPEKEANLQKRENYLRNSTSKLQEQIDSLSDRIENIFKESQAANSKTSEREAQLISWLKSISSQFKSDCKELCNTIQNTFSSLQGD